MFWAKCKRIGAVSGEDFLDTWGLGQVLKEDLGEREIDAIAIRDGYVAKTADSGSIWHWTQGLLKKLPAHEKFLLDQTIKIGVLAPRNE